MFKAFYAGKLADEVWGLPMKGLSARGAATGMVTICERASAAGPANLYVAGEHVAVDHVSLIIRSSR